MNLHDDPRLTAYALGELDDNECAEIEALLENNADTREELEIIRTTAHLLEVELQQEPVTQLTEEQRKEVEAAIGGTTKTATRSRGWKRVIWLSKFALAASFLVVAGAWLFTALLPSRGGSSINIARLERFVESFAVSALEESPPPSGSMAIGGDSMPTPARSVPAARYNRQEGVERFLITDINGPAVRPMASPSAAATPSSDHGGLQNVQVVEGKEKYMLSGFGHLVPPGGSVPAAPDQGKLQVGEARDQLKALGYMGSANSVPAAPKPSVEQRTRLNAEATYRYDINGSGVENLPLYRPSVAPGTEKYEPIVENSFRRVAEEPLSTFSVDVDTASYANVRRFLNEGQLPPPNAVRIEELINYFDYDYPAPQGDSPFSVAVDVHPCPWTPEHQLARIGLRGTAAPIEERPICNLVFLLDVSGSMSDANKLPLLKQGMALLTQSLKPQDRIGIVTYCTNARVALESVSGDQKGVILSLLDSLNASGSTNGWDGIQLAYDMAARHFIEHGVNRVILCTDGDFNVGISDTDSVTRMIQDKAKSGVFLSVLGFGQGNLQDDKLEALADKGNGHYAYIDSFNEARRVLLDKIAGTLFTIAKDVKIQVEFNPIRVGAYRLIGYENRTMAAKDFNNDRKDAGEIGADHRVTALYELVPPGQPISAPGVDPLKYQERETAPQPSAAAGSNELMTVKLRYKRPDGDTSIRTDIPIPASADTEASGDFRFAAGVAAFGMLLRGSEYRGGATFDQALDLAQQGKGLDPEGRRAEFINLVKTAQALAGN